MRRIVMVCALMALAWPTLAMGVGGDGGPRGAAAVTEGPNVPPEGWAPADPADSLWRAAREAFNSGEFAAAAGIYRRIRTEAQFSASEYRAPSFYWEAFARHRVGSASEMRTARDILRELRTAHPGYPQMAEVERLAARIDQDLAARGDAQAAQRASAMVSQALAPPTASPAVPATPPVDAPAAPAPGARRPAQQVACPDQEMRMAALEALINMPAETAMPILTQVMARTDACNAPLRETAVFLVAQKGGAEAADILLETARSDSDPEVRQQAVFWLSQVDSDAALAALEEILATASDDELTEQAVFALSQHPSPRAAELLRDIAERPGTDVEDRKNAIFWLGQRRDDGTAEYLRGLYSSLDDPELKESALFALSQNGDADSGAFLVEVALDASEPIEARKQALFWAGQSRALPMERMAELYGTVTDREMKEQIVFAISQSGEPDAVVPLIEIARAETDLELKKTLVFWIGQSRDPRAVAFITQLIGGGQ